MAKFKPLNTKWEVYCCPRQELGRGKSAIIYPGLDHSTGKQVAIKQQVQYWSPGPEGSTLCHEYRVYQELGKTGGGPKVYGHCHESCGGSDGRQYRCYLIMERLGPSLHKAMSHKKSRPRLANSLFFSLREVASIGTQIISDLQLLHDNGLVHRNVQPGNIVYDLAEKRVLLIDYGAAQKYRETTSPKHSDLTSDMAGSPVFTSLNSHSGNASARRDDLESLGYVLVYLYRGKLPWQHLGFDASDQLIASKSSIRMEESCDRLEPFDEYFEAVNQLVPDRRPDYAGLQRILKALARSIPIDELI